MSAFRVTYSYCGDVSSHVILADNPEHARTQFLQQWKSGTRIIKIVEEK